MPLMQIDYGSSEYQEMISLREEILRRPLGLGFTVQDLEPDKEDILIAAKDDGKMIACCILRKESDEAIRLRQMAVKNNQQGKGIGQQVMRFAETLARDKGYRIMVMHARDTAIGFYQKQGYKVVGDMFHEVTIPHHRMEKILI